jgi:uncharacterized membrane protein
MKVKTALQHSQSSARFLAVVLMPILGMTLILNLIWHIHAGWVCVVYVVFMLLLEGINILRITRRAKYDPCYLERRIN